MPGYEVWMYHGKSVRQTALVVEEDDDKRSDDRMDEILDAIRPELKTDPVDPFTSEVQFFLTFLEL
jgi:hypothetical protein